MCLALPRRILSVDGDDVVVEWDGGPMQVRAAGVPNLVPGELVIVHAGQVLDRVAPEDAEEILALYASLEAASP